MTDDDPPGQMDVWFTLYGVNPLREVYARAAMAHLMRGGAYRVTDNGDGTYTHEWTAKPRDDSGEYNGEDNQP